MSSRNIPGLDAAQVQELALGVLADKLDVARSNITMESLLAEDLGMDSFGAVELIFALENKYGLEIPEKDAQAFKKVGDVVAYLQARTAC